ncbi:MAG: type II toxin-antitoxin system YafQ family toxin [Desulfovibrio sp.]|nr:type II toxin-antitoxin system YafQ family toxin [Desulfovibrio sp.]
MREIVSTAAFRKDFKRLSRSGRHDLALLKEAISLLAGGESLPERLRDHPLGSNWQGFRECHVRPDWLLIYKLTPEALTLVRTGSHTELFD